MTEDSDTFEWKDATLRLFHHPYNVTAQNERAVEIAIAQHFLAGRTGDGLELGNVLGHYGLTTGHRVIDLYETGENVENVDFLTVPLTMAGYDWAVSISTLEHVGWDDRRDQSGALEALNRLRSILRPDGTALISVPLGWHPTLDALIAHGGVPVLNEAFYGWRDPGRWQRLRGRPWRPYNVAAHRAEVVWVAEVPSSVS